jgi:hypothetical protein
LYSRGSTPRATAAARAAAAGGRPAAPSHAAASCTASAALTAWWAPVSPSAGGPVPGMSGASDARGGGTAMDVPTRAAHSWG